MALVSGLDSVPCPAVLGMMENSRTTPRYSTTYMAKRVAVFGIKEGRDATDVYQFPRRVLCHLLGMVFEGKADADGAVEGEGLTVHHQVPSVCEGNLASRFKHNLGLLRDEFPFLASCNDDSHDVDVMHGLVTAQVDTGER